MPNLDVDMYDDWTRPSPISVDDTTSSSNRSNPHIPAATVPRSPSPLDSSPSQATPLEGGDTITPVENTDPKSIGHAKYQYEFTIPSNHSLVPCWPSLLPRIAKVIDDLSSSPGWSIDPIAIGPDRPSSRTVIWVGCPNWVSPALALDIVNGIVEVCSGYPVIDYNVEVHTSRTQKQCSLVDPDTVPRAAISYADPFASTLGTPVSASSHPNCCGTASITVQMEGATSLSMITASHVLRPEEHHHSLDHPVTGALVTIHNPDTLEASYPPIIAEIRDTKRYRAIIQSSLDRALMKGNINKTLDTTIAHLDNKVKELEEWLTHLSTSFALTPHQLGHVGSCPPITYNVSSSTDKTGDFGNTEDWGFIDTDFTLADFPYINCLNLNDASQLAKAAAHPEVKPELKVTSSGYLAARPCLGRDDLTNGKKVAGVKNGAATGVTLGETNGLYSALREGGEWTKGLLVLGFDGQAFSKEGDSGSVVLHRDGPIVGLLTGGKIGHPDRTYLTPWYFLEERFRAHGLEVTIPYYTE